MYRTLWKVLTYGQLDVSWQPFHYFIPIFIAQPDIINTTWICVHLFGRGFCLGKENISDFGYLRLQNISPKSA